MRRPNIETLIFENNYLILEKDKEENEQLNQQNLVTKKYELRMNMDKKVTMRISRNLDKANKFIFETK